MELAEILLETSCQVLSGPADIEIHGIAYDSRQVKAGYLFVCIKGLVSDGHQYISQAVANGSSAILVQQGALFDAAAYPITIISAENTRKALAMLSGNFFGRPASRMNFIGVTGTNGKTTTTTLIFELLMRNQIKAGLIGTNEIRIGSKVLPAERTTPESLELHQLFSQMLDNGVTHVVMEVSSHAIDLFRTEGLHFMTGIFTNISQDHLDYHKTMEAYTDTKSEFFTQCRHAVINTDDPASAHMIQKAAGSIVTYGIDEPAQFQAKDIQISPEGVVFTVEKDNSPYEFQINTPGKFSVYNALGVIAAGDSLNLNMKQLQEGLKAIKGIRGRFQTIRLKNGAAAIVDYSHTPDSLENALKTIHEFVQGKVITVFGCGGNRDKTKRPIMGEVAGTYSDFCVMTSDNPRDEEPIQILDDIEVGLKRTLCDYIKIPDRKEAILYALEAANSDDIVLIAGKGHEDYQEIMGRKIHLDDMETVIDYIGGK